MAASRMPPVWEEETPEVLGENSEAGNEKYPKRTEAALTAINSLRGIIVRSPVHEHETTARVGWRTVVGTRAGQLFSSGGLLLLGRRTSSLLWALSL
jgi:hypothetical protein